MAYPYYCTHCGKELNQEIVLFNMIPALTGKESEEFSLIRFRMTKQELEKLVSSGTRLENGYSRCRLSFAEVMGFIGNDNNNSIRAISGITLQDVDEYCAAVKAQFSVHEEVSIPEGILAMERDLAGNEDIMFIRHRLCKEFRILCEAFSQSDFCEFEIKLDFETDNNDKPVLVGYFANTGLYDRCMMEGKRLCPCCGNAVIPHAGAVPQKIVAFIGGMRASKTTTMLALVHYAWYGCCPPMIHSIWADAERIPQICHFELLDPSDNLRGDMVHYEQGISPPKYRCDEMPTANLLATKSDYSKVILTLLNPPGELFDAYINRVNTDLLFNHFPILLKADVLIHCVSNRTLDPAANIRPDQYNMTTDLSCAESLVSALSSAGFYPPVLTLFTDLPEQCSYSNSPLVPKGINLLHKEYGALQHNPLTANYLQMAGHFSNMRMDSPAVYRNAMYCHPMGYDTPVINMYDLSEKDEQPVQPSPVKIPLLMRWILYVTGILPTEFEQPATGELIQGYVTRTQYRQENPVDKIEAVARCILFQNPGQNDVSLMRASNAAQQLLVKFRMKRQSNSESK